MALASAKHHTHALSLKIVQSALLSPHTPEGHLQHPSLLWLVRQLLLADQFKILRKKLKFQWEKNVHNITESR